jgi:asparagine synthase (glutamine-hydrolysing)
MPLCSQLGSLTFPPPLSTRTDCRAMCGVAGLVGYPPGEKVLSAAQKMAAAMRHRGPDSCGITSLTGCVLVNTRLAIVELSDRGRQPMPNPEQTVWISYNGETYNASELRQDLIDKGYSFKSKSDTEVVLKLYEDYGDECARHMRGMFAFAIWDARKGKLLLVRDRLGIKPLYFARQSGALIFGSELKCLLASGLIDPRTDARAVGLYLQLGHVPPPRSIIEGVQPLPPGHTATWQDGKFTVSPYWSLTSCDDKPGRLPINPAEQLGDILLESVQRQLVSDVPIALFLSGGVDSASLSALVRAARGENITAITLGFSELEFDETPLARETAKILGLPFEAAMLTPDRVAQEIDSCISVMDQPSVDGINSYWISKISAEYGFKVALSGQGADELFGGYRSWKWFTRFERIAAWTRRFPPSFSRLFDREEWPYRWRKLGYLFGDGDPGDGDPFLASQLAVRVLFLGSDLARLLLPGFLSDATGAGAREYLKTSASDFSHIDDSAILSFMDIRTHLQPRLLRDLDAMSMAHSLEVRPAFLDHRIVEFVLALPDAARRPKELLLASIKRFMPAELSTALRNRAKRTFTFPFAKWLARDLKPRIDDTFSPKQLSSRGVLNGAEVQRVWKRFQRAPEAVGWSRVWSLFVLARWCELMKVRP